VQAGPRERHHKERDEPRERDPRVGFFSDDYLDHTAPFTANLGRRLADRWRLVKRDPSAALSEPVAPIVFHLDRGIPEPERSAIRESALWWNHAFEEAGFRNALVVRDLPEGASLLDARYTGIAWVSRAERAWSIGQSQSDPRTGEIVHAVVLLDSHRRRTTARMWENLAPPGSRRCDAGDAPDVSWLAGMARSADALLEEAESVRELALVFRALGRNQDALRQLNASQRLFQRLDARSDLVDVTSRLEELEETFLAVVREWGQSIESADSYTHGHCARVATYAVDVARALGLEEGELVTIRIGAYLHDLGKIHTPHEILNKHGRLTDEEFAIMKRHPVQGVELLADIDFPWDIKPMIRWHHEKHCGGGYPDGLEGDAIPLNAQIICIADVFDALTSTRSYREAMDASRALAIMHESRRWWRDDVFEAFLGARQARLERERRDDERRALDTAL